jgi:DNA-binding transcriptional MocR family regulator
MKLYQQLADDLTVLIRQGALKPGDRVPSVRETSRERGMSPATVIHAYELLEGQGFIETRPRSGYYVGNQWTAPAQQPRISRPSARSTLLDVSDLVFEVWACWFMTSFQNPLGALVPDEARQELVQLLELHDVPLIEDDVYAELYFGSRRPKSTKAFDHKGLVLNCGSFSKSLAPGYRIGWVAAGRFARSVGRRKVMSSLSTNIPAQDAIALYLRQGGYDRHLSVLRRTFATQQKSALQALHAHLPPGFTVTQPKGGYFLWLEFPEHVDAIDVHRKALEQGFSIAPGPIFSARREFAHCLRLNYGHEWTTASERAIKSLGAIVRS